MPAVWYCCSCGDGPHDIKRKPRCDCGHDRCVDCGTEHTDGTDTGSDFGDTQSECSDVAHSILPANIVNPISSQTHHDVASTTNEISPANLPSSILSGVLFLTPNTTIGCTRLTQANLGVFNHAVPQTQHPHHHHPPTNRGPTEQYWVCCECKETWNSCRYNSECTKYGCYHKQCEYCEIETPKK